MPQPTSPLYRDPIFDGAADPVVVWNRAAKSWWMFYTQRRANVDSPGVAYCHGCTIGVAVSEDNGATWVYQGGLQLGFREWGESTFWAPDIVFHDGLYHMFVGYIPGVPDHWRGKARMAHYTSANLWQWTFEGLIKLSSDGVIDATLLQMPDDQWRMWYKDDTRGSVTMVASSANLRDWELSLEPAIGGKAHEGAKVFRFGDWYWMLTDEWGGMRVYRSEDCETWEKQGMILDGPSTRPEDTPCGAHGDVVVVEGRAYVFYFSHPGRPSHFGETINEDGIVPYSQRRSSIHVAPLAISTLR